MNNYEIIDLDGSAKTVAAEYYQTGDGWVVFKDEDNKPVFSIREQVTATIERTHAPGVGATD